MYQIKTEQFNGPLDLLLNLIENQKLDISQLALAKVTDQYLIYIEANEISATDLADFLVVATKLLIIKSKVLLPQFNADDEDSAEELEAQLKLYKDYLLASKIIEQMLAKNNFCFSREKVAFTVPVTFSPPQGLAKNELALIFSEILKRIDYVISLPTRVMEKTISLKEMVTEIKQALAKIKTLNFNSLLAKTQTRTEMVVCFMALLELIKEGQVAVTQQGVFDEILIKSVS